MSEWRSFSLLAERPTAFGGWEFVIDGDVQHRLVWHPEDAHLRDAATLRPFLGAPVASPTSKAARAAAHALVTALNADDTEGFA